MKKITILGALFFALQMIAPAQWRHESTETGGSVYKLTPQVKDSRLEVHCVDGTNYIYFLGAPVDSEPGVDLWFDAGPGRNAQIEPDGRLSADFVLLLFARRVAIAYTLRDGTQGYAAFNVRGVERAARQLPCSP
jgi:hypothetical protein